MPLRDTFLHEASFALEELSRRGGYTFTTADRALLTRAIRATAITWRGGLRIGPRGEVAYKDGLLSPDISDTESATSGRILAASFQGFFDAAADGLPLAQLGAVGAMLGKPVHRAYPIATQTFVRFATTYWTLKVLVRNGYSADQIGVSIAMLDRIERQIGPLFFPGNAEFMAASQREIQQRKILGEFGRRIDADEFVKDNPFLD